MEGDAGTRQPPARPGIKQVAARAGVSWKTVSNVINGTAFVKEETKARVEEAIRELGYRPNLASRNLRRGRSNLLALAFPDLRNPYFADLAHRLIMAARERGFRVLIDETSADPDSERNVAAGFGVHLLDGIILSPQALSSHEIAAANDDLPIVLLGEESLPGPDEPPMFNHVVIDNIRSAKELTQHLLSGGRQHVAFVGTGAGLAHGTGALRRAGYEAALADAGLRSSSTFFTPWYTRAVGAATIESALTMFRGESAIDALVCANDQLAIGAMGALGAAGIHVPDDVAVVGWDDTEEGAYSSPTLTSIAPDPGMLVETALRLLGELIAGSPEQPRVHIVPHVLHERESSRGRAR